MNDQDARFLSFFLREPVYVVPEPDPPPAEVASVPEISRRGTGQREILILVSESDHEFLSPPDQVFLEKILQAVSLSPDDVTLINTRSLTEYVQQGFSMDELLSTVSYQTCLVFGTTPDHWSLSSFFEPYAVREGLDNHALLLADPLSVIAHSTDKKAKLWKCLQQLFRV